MAAYWLGHYTFGDAPLTQCRTTSTWSLPICVWLACFTWFTDRAALGSFGSEGWQSSRQGGHMRAYQAANATSTCIRNLAPKSRRAYSNPISSLEAFCRVMLMAFATQDHDVMVSSCSTCLPVSLSERELL